MLKYYSSENYQQRTNNNNNLLIDDDDTCPNTGLWPYIFSIQYFVLLKLIMMTLLYALFR